MKPKKKKTKKSIKQKSQALPKLKAKAIKQSFQKTFPIGFWSKHWIPAALLFVLALGLYISTMNFQYVLDDIIVFNENQFVQKGFAGLKDIFTTESFTGYFGQQKDLLVGARYRPLSIASFAVEHQFFGQNSKVSHLINVLLYGLTALLLYRVICLFLPAFDKRNWWATLPFIASLLFVTHPVHSEVVANVKGRDEIMTMIGVLATMYFYIRYIYEPKVLWLILIALIFFVSGLAKESALPFLAVIPLTVYFFFPNSTLKRNAIALVPLTLAAVAYLVVRYNSIGYLLNVDKEITDLMNNPFHGMTGSEKYATIMYTLLEYVRLLFVPHPLTHDYYPYHIPKMNWGDIGSIGGLLMYAGMIIYAAWSMFKKSLPGYCVIFYLLTLVVVSNLLVGVGTFMNERFIYISSLGYCLLLAYWLVRKLPQWLPNNNRALTIGASIGIAIAVIYSVLTVIRVPAWESKLSLNEAAIKVSKNSARANCFIGTALFEKYKTAETEEEKKNLLNRAEGYFQKSLEIHPVYGNSLSMKAGVAAELYKRDRDLDKLLASFLEVLKVRHVDYIDEYNAYLAKRGNEVALEHFYHEIGLEFFGKKHKRWNSAIKYLNDGLKYSPGSYLMQKDLCIVNSSGGKYQKAIEHGLKALNINAMDAELLFHLGQAYTRAGNAQAGQGYLDKAASIDPNYKR